MALYLFVNRTGSSQRIRLRNDHLTVEPWSELEMNIEDTDCFMIGNDLVNCDCLTGFRYILFNADGCVSSNHHKPVFLLSHQCNRSSLVRHAIINGANGIEADLHIDASDEPWVTHDNDRSLTLKEWVNEIIRFDLTHLKLVMFDVKTGEDLSKTHSIAEPLRKSGLFILYSVSNLNKAGIFKSIIHQLTAQESFCIDEENEIDEVVKFYREIGARSCWYGNGLFSLGPDLNVIHSSLQLAAQYRKRRELISHTIAWTTRLENSVREFYLEDDVDAVIVEPGSLKRISQMINASAWLKMI